MSQGFINPPSKAVSAGDYFPNQPAFVNPDVDVPYPLIADPDGSLQIRGGVLTDEGAKFDHFNGDALSDDWTTVIGTGGSVAVSGSQVTLSSGTTANALTQIALELDYLPLRLDIWAMISQRIANQDIWIGVTNDPDPSNETEYAYYQFNGTNPLKVYCVSANNDVVEGDTDLLDSPVSSADFASWTMSILTETLDFAVGVRNLDKETMVLHENGIPGPYTGLFLVIRIKNRSSAPASSTDIVVDYVRTLNVNRIDISQKFQQDGAFTQIAGYDSIAGKSRKVGTDSQGRLFVTGQDPSASMITLVYDDVFSIAGAQAGEFYQALSYSIATGKKFNLGHMLMYAEDDKMFGRVSKNKNTGSYNIGTNTFVGTGIVYTPPEFASYLEASVVTAIGSTADVTLSITYVNQDGTAGRTATCLVPKSTPAGYKIKAALQSGDYGVQQVTAVTKTGTNTGIVNIQMGVTVITYRVSPANTTVFIAPPKESVIVSAGEDVIMDIQVTGVSSVRRRLQVTGLLEAI